MFFDADREFRLDRLDQALLAADEPTYDLFSEIITGICARFAALKRSPDALRVVKLIEAGAWTDAALALLELELPVWRIRRLAYEDGEWICSLSQQPNVPIALDDVVDARHGAMPFAILLAFLAARRVGAMSCNIPADAAGLLAPAASLCCDNFA